MATSVSVPQAVITMLVFAALFVILDYYNFHDNSYEHDRLIKLDVTASDTPKFDHTKGERGFLIKAQEFNCQFLIRGPALRIVRDNAFLQERVEAIKRGDKLVLTILGSDSANLGSLYLKAHLAGLQVEGQPVYSSRDVQLQLIKNRQSTRFGFGAIWVVFVLGFILYWTTKPEDDKLPDADSDL